MAVREAVMRTRGKPPLPAQHTLWSHVPVLGQHGAPEGHLGVSCRRVPLLPGMGEQASRSIAQPRRSGMLEWP